MKISRQVGALLGLLVLGGCSREYEPAPDLEITASYGPAGDLIASAMAPDSVRRQLAEEWIDQADSVARLTGNEEASRMVAFARANYRLARPGEGKAAVQIDPITGDSQFKFVVILREENLPSEFWRQIDSQAGAGGLYHPGHDMLVMSANHPTSPLGRGLVLAHEITHIIQELSPNPGSSQQSNEVPALEFQFSLTRQLGGERDATILEGHIAAMKFYVNQDTAKRLGYDFPKPQMYDPRLDEVFGPPESEAERTSRKQMLWVNACFGIMDEVFARKEPGEVLKYKTEFYRRLALAPVDMAI